MNKYDINNLTGLLLLATNRVGSDPLFKESIIYIVKHQVAKGAEGIILNKPTKLPFYKLFDMVEADVSINLSQKILEENMILIGGPDLVKSTFLIEEDLSYKVLTESILENLVSRVEGARFEVAAGLAAWSAGQLEREIFNDMWVPVATDKTVMFDLPYVQRYPELVNKLDLAQYLQRIAGYE